MRTISETSRTILILQHSNHRSPRRRRQKERPWENTWGDNSWKLPLNGEGNSHPSPRNPESPKQIKSKAKHPKTHINKIKKIKHKEQILKAAREKQQITYKGIPIRKQLISIETLQAKREWQDILKVVKEKKPTTQITVPSKDLIQIWRRNQKLYRQAKAERIRYHQTSSSTNAKGSSLDRKYRKGL